MIFDKIIIITMEKNKDRQEYCKNLMKKLGWEFEFFYAKPHKNGGTWGCYQSHMLVIEKCIKNNYEYVLICEDDLTPTKYFNAELLSRAENFMKNNNKWEIFLMGYTLCADDHPTDNLLVGKYDENIYRIRACLTHCYAIQRNTYKRVLNILKDNYKPSNNSYEHVDKLYSRTTRMYGVNPNLFDQKWCFGSDNPANNLLEKNLKKLTCFAERNKILPLFSYYFYTPAIFYLYILIFLIPVFLVWFIKYKKK